MTMNLIFELAIALSIHSMNTAYATVSFPPTACGDQKPENSGPPQRSDSPYMVHAESNFFVKNADLFVELTADDESTPRFNGFYCQARDQANRVVGRFKYVGGDEFIMGHMCPQHAVDFNTVSHTSDWYNGTENEIYLTWTTKVGISSVSFRCTFAQNTSTFWVGVNSTMIKDIATVNVSECCEREGIPLACRGLCRPFSMAPAPGSLNTLAMLLEQVVNDTEMECSLTDAQKALRCSYWSKQDLVDPTRRLNALTECCEFHMVNEYCTEVLCNSSTTLASLDYVEDNVSKNCILDSSATRRCLIYPEWRTPETTQGPFISPEATTTTSSVPPESSSLPSTTSRFQSTGPSSTVDTKTTTTTSSVPPTISTFQSTRPSSTVDTTTTSGNATPVGLSAGAIAGIVVIILLLLIVIILMVICRKRPFVQMVLAVVSCKICKDKKSRNRGISKKSISSSGYNNPDYEKEIGNEPIYMDITDDVPPQLPKRQTLPSNTDLYDQAHGKYEVAILPEDYSGYLKPTATPAEDRKFKHDHTIPASKNKQSNDDGNNKYEVAYSSSVKKPLGANDVTAIEGENGEYDTAWEKPNEYLDLADEGQAVPSTRFNTKTADMSDKVSLEEHKENNDSTPAKKEEFSASYAGYEPAKEVDADYDAAIGKGNYIDLASEMGFSRPITSTEGKDSNYTPVGDAEDHGTAF